MKQINTNIWEANVGMIFQRRIDEFIIGARIQLGINNITKEPDSINNYKEVLIENKQIRKK